MALTPIGNIKKKYLMIQQMKFPWSLYSGIFVMGLIIVCAMVFSFLVGKKMIEKYTPLIDAVMEIRLEATTAHLWFEEIISGDAFEDMDIVKNHFEQSLWYATAMLEGGENSEGIFLPLTNPILRKEIEEVRGKIQRLQKITEQRFKSKQDSGIGTVNDQLYDSVFRDLSYQSDMVESKLQAEMEKQLQILRLLHYFTISLGVISVIAILLIVHRFERKSFQNTKLLHATNNNLQDALNEVRTLQGILPICSYCKKIRDEEGIWYQIEAYIDSHADVTFSHGACPDCYSRQMEELHRLHKIKQNKAC